MTTKRIHVVVNSDYAPKWAKSEAAAFKAWLVLQMAVAGVPIIGGPIAPELDYSKGSLEVWDSMCVGDKNYLWTFKEVQK